MLRTKARVRWLWSGEAHVGSDPADRLVARLEQSARPRPRACRRTYAAMGSRYCTTEGAGQAGRLDADGAGDLGQPEPVGVALGQEVVGVAKPAWSTGLVSGAQQRGQQLEHPAFDRQRRDVVGVLDLCAHPAGERDGERVAGERQPAG